MSTPAKNPVQLVGAGPGDPELITVKAMYAIQSADLLFYPGSPAPEVVVRWAGSARTVNSAGMQLDEIMLIITEAYGKGQKVVRLHSGEPSLYSAVSEQKAALELEQIDYEIIPGITAAFAAAASLKTAYTHPEVCQSLIVTRMEGRMPVPAEQRIAALAAHRASMVVYLSAGYSLELQPVLVEHYGREAPVAVVHKASRPDECVVRTTAGNLVSAMAEHNICSHSVILAGSAISLNQPSPNPLVSGRRAAHGSDGEKRGLLTRA